MIKTSSVFTVGKLALAGVLAAAGLETHNPPEPVRAVPQPAAPRIELEIARPGPLDLTPLRAAPRRSVWRLAVPFMALAGLAVAVHETVGVDGLVAAGRQLQTAGDALRQRTQSTASARNKSPEQHALPEESAPAPPVAAPATAQLAARPATPPPPAPRPEPLVLSFATHKITVRESQSMVVLDIVRASGVGAGSVVWWTTDDTAHARDDYASFGKRTERFGPEDNGRRIIIPIVSDSLREAAEHFQVHIAAARTDASDGTRIGAIDTVDVTILDDDDS